jgi:two-component system, cell cycle sensor histidine kinase and response regulator CckA
VSTEDDTGAETIEDFPSVVPSTSNRRSLSLLEETPALLALAHGPEHRFSFCNALFRSMVGRSEIDPTAPGRVSIPELDAQGFFGIMDEVFATGSVHRGDQIRTQIAKKPAGAKASKTWFNFVFQPTFDALGEVEGVLCHAVEVTELVQARREAEAATRRFQDLVQGIDAIVWEADVGSVQFSFVSQRAEHLLGYPLEQWLKPGFWFQIIHPADLDRAKRMARVGIDDGTGHEFVYRVLAANGRTVWLHDIVQVGVDEEGKPAHVRGVMVDITERKEAEVERERMHSQLLQVQKLESLGVLAGGIAHDFNNLLTGILGNASMVLSELPEDSTLRPALEELTSGAGRAADLTRQLLAYSGKGRFQVDVLNLSGQVQEIVNLLAASMPKKVRMKLELANDLLGIQGDVAQIQQVIMNLVLNAAEAIGEQLGTVLVRTSVVEHNNPAASGSAPRPTPSGMPQSGYSSVFSAQGPLNGRYVLLEVQDTGMGMDTNTRDRVFDPFFTTKAGGRGLGLSAVLGIVRGHGGALRIESKPNRGTTFQVFFPATEQRAPESRRAVVTPLKAEMKGTILIVDDEPVVRSLAARVIKRLGLEVVQAANGAAGVYAFEVDPDRVSAVLLDLTMPDMSGDEVFQRLSKIRPGVKVILSSGYDRREATRNLGSLEPAGFLPKPYTAQSLRDIIGAVLQSE